MKNEIPLFREFPFFRHNQLVVVSIIRRNINYALFWHNWNLFEVSSQFEYSLRRRALSLETSACLSLECGNLTLDHQLVWCHILVFHFPTDATLQFISSLPVQIKIKIIIILIITVYSQTIGKWKEDKEGYPYLVYPVII